MQFNRNPGKYAVNLWKTTAISFRFCCHLAQLSRRGSHVRTGVVTRGMRGPERVRGGGIANFIRWSEQGSSRWSLRSEQTERRNRKKQSGLAKPPGPYNGPSDCRAVIYRGSARDKFDARWIHRILVVWTQHVGTRPRPRAICISRKAKTVFAPLLFRRVRRRSGIVLVYGFSIMPDSARKRVRV